jgi:ATP-dependent DNA helicase RecG
MPSLPGLTAGVGLAAVGDRGTPGCSQVGPVASRGTAARRSVPNGLPCYQGGRDGHHRSRSADDTARDGAVGTIAGVPSSRPEPGVGLRQLAERGVADLRGVGPKKVEALASVGVHTVLDLLTTYPRRWVDRTNEARVVDLVPGQEALVVVTVRSVTKRITRNRRSMVTAQVGDGSGRLSLVFFNQPWRERQLRPGLTVALFGKPDVYRGGLQMTNPVVDLLGDRTGRIVPIYPQSEKADLSTWEIAGWVATALERCRPRGIADPVPTDVSAGLGLVERGRALFGIHQPDTLQEKEAARRRLAFDELLRVQLVLVQRKRALEAASVGVRHDLSGELVDRFHKSLPFTLTDDQRAVIDEIERDLAAPRPMHRLLQGDVGSGKTVVALTALLTAVQGGHQGALMAPTEVLAEQHALTVRELLAPITVPAPESLFAERPLHVVLLTNRRTAAERREVLSGLADGSVDLVIGTHALIQEAVQFHSLGVVVIDEQHRFGVEQRAALRRKGEQGEAGAIPDVLVMTATPIPRTAAMTVYGDLDVSTITSKPAGRRPVVTSWADGEAAEDAVWGQVRAEVQAGRQAYVVCPLIEDSDKLEVSSAEETFRRLSAGELQGLRLGLLHGRMASAEKEQVMDSFRRGALEVLVATTVIEVGVDVPNATTMVILDADRFGIAQLHQLRGRVGRGDAASTCWLVTAGLDEIPARVQALVDSSDGFHLAEVDLELRGEGTIMNTAQKGRNDLKLASLRRDRELVGQARDAAFTIVDGDPGLRDHPELLDELALFFDDEDEADSGVRRVGDFAKGEWLSKD